MKLMKLVILSLIPTYLLNINDAYTMNDTTLYQDCPEMIDTIKNNYNNDIICSNSFLTSNNYKVDNMCSLAALTQLFSILNPIEYGNSDINLLCLFSLAYELNTKNNNNICNPGDIFKKALQLHYNKQFQDPDDLFKKVFNAIESILGKEVFQDTLNDIDNITNLDNLLIEYKIELTDQEKNEFLFFFAQNMDVVERLNAFLSMLPKEDREHIEKLNPIVNIAPEKELPIDCKIDVDMNKEKLEKIIFHTLTKDKKYSNEEINDIQNIFIDIGNFSNIKYLYNAICYEDGTYYIIGDNVFELAGAVLCTYNKDGTARATGNHYVAIKKGDNGKFRIINSVDANNKQIYENHYGTNYSSLDKIITRLKPVVKNKDGDINYILLPRLVVLRKVLNKNEINNNKHYNAETLKKLTEINEQMFDILRQLDIVKLMMEIDEIIKKKEDPYMMLAYWNDLQENAIKRFHLDDKYTQNKSDLTIKTNECINNFLNKKTKNEKEFQKLFKNLSELYVWDKTKTPSEILAALKEQYIKHYSTKYNILKNNQSNNNKQEIENINLETKKDNNNKINNVKNINNNEHILTEKKDNIKLDYINNFKDNNYKMDILDEKIKDININNNKEAKEANTNEIKINDDIKVKGINSINDKKELMLLNQKQELEDKRKMLQTEIDKLTIDIVNKYIKYLKNSNNNEWNKKVIPTLDKIRNTTKVYDSDENMLKAAFLEFMNKLYEDFPNDVINKNTDIINAVFEEMTYAQNSALFYIPYSKNDKDLALLVKLFETKQKLENVNKEIATLEEN